MKKVLRKSTAWMLMLSLALAMLGSLGFQKAKASGVGGVYPKMPSASSLVVVNIANDSAEAKLADLSLQGILNQSSASIYLITRVTDQQLLDSCGKPYTVLTPLSGTNPGLRTLFNAYKNQINEMDVYDPSADWTFNIALMKGSLSKGIAVTSALKSSLISEFGWSGTVVDYTNNWSSRVSAYDWAIANLMPSLNKQVIFSAGLRSDWRTSPWLIFDYAVASKSFIFWLDENSDSEKTEIQTICQTSGYPQCTPLMGYGYNGDSLLNAVEPYGFAWTVGDYYSNESVWSSFSNKTYTQPSGSAITTSPNKIYVSFILSDGDNVFFDEDVIRRLWSDPARGSVPVGTTLAPTLQELNSPLLDWYYSNKTSNDELMCGPNGWQFVYNDSFNASKYSSWLTSNNQWNNGAGFHISFTDGALGGTNNNLFLQNSGLDGTFLYNGGSTTPYYYNNSVEISTNYFAGKYGDVYNELSTITPSSSSPLFVSVYITVAKYCFDSNNNPVGFTNIQNEINKLNTDFPGRFTFLKPGDLIASAKSLAKWQNIGGTTFDKPAVTSKGSNELDVFIRGTDNQLYQNIKDGSNWQGFTGLGGTIVGAPAAVSWGSGRIDVVARGTTNQLYHKFYANNQWSGWESLGGVLSDSPAISSQGSSLLDVFVRQNDNQLYVKSYNGSAWSGFTSLGGPTNGTFTGAPAAVSWGSGRTDVFVRGGDNALWHKYYFNSQWSAWENLGGVLTDSPTVSTKGTNELDVFVRGTDNRIWQKTWNGTSWSGFVAQNGPSGTGLLYAPAVFSRSGSGTIDIAAIGTDNSVYWNKSLG